MDNLKRIFNLRSNAPLVGVNLAALLLFLLVSLNYGTGQPPANARVVEISSSNLQEVFLQKGDPPGESEALYSQPIFHLDRHAAAKPTPPVVQVAAPTFNLELTGVLKVSPTMGWAFLRPRGGAETRQVALGETIQGWVLEDIREAQVMLSNGSQKITLTMVGADIPMGQGQTVSVVNSGQKPRTRRKR